LVADLLAEDSGLERVPVDQKDWPGLENAVSTAGEFRTTPAMLPATDGFPGGLDGFFASVLRRR
jgi:16S rRNA (cytosine967-C5)-methyltransferase